VVKLGKTPVFEAWLQALAIAREAAANPDYLGPSIEALEQVAAAIAEIRGQVNTWHLDEQVRRASRPRRLSRAKSHAIRKALAEARRPLHRSRNQVIAELYGRG
jgi:hypothetical protein